ncbi:nitrous oxide reductase accessory protein NosL [Natronomonas sp. LN261]|uniref:nitrous oxide reductase accessory protein NosL n=1 Tax=Natronomonas sp. LN261 TaxID=2750669 RepID=UPI001C67529C
MSTRRDVLSVTGAGLLAGLAGCTGNGDGTEDGTDGEGTETPAGDGEGTETPADDAEASLGDPVEFPEDAECPVCNMMPAEHPEWNAQLAHENEDRAFFCSSGCLAAYVAYTDRFGGPDSPLHTAWVTGFETGDLLRTSDAYFVRVADPDHVDDIMMRNPTPFAGRSGAEAFVEEFDAYGDEDIITFDEFDEDLATFYREDLIEGSADDAEASLGDPVEFPEDAECPVCNMMPAEYPAWNAQLAHENGDRAFFDTSGCLAAYVAYTDRFGGPDSTLQTAWVTGFETGELLPASDAYFVRVTDPDHVDDVMMRNPTPFADRSDAEAFVEEFDVYGDEDIITFDEFDEDLATFYREDYVEGDGGMDDMDME